MIPASRLRQLRNDIPIGSVIEALGLLTKESEGLLRFLCPLCSEFHTATNPKTNLARCFRCCRNFNPIDMAMTVRGYRFLDAVRFLEAFSDDQKSVDPGRQ
jgi:hypothetical protein